MNAGQRMGFGHRHGEAEEIYVVLGGSGRMKLDEEVVELAPQDIVYVPPAVVREWESGPEGLQLIAFGSHAESDVEMIQGWWTD
jgi:mannose-6-phosphate isomerase-like protein (cupin superfamily)